MRKLPLVLMTLLVAAPAWAGGLTESRAQLPKYSKGFYHLSADGKFLYTQPMDPVVETKGIPRVVFPTYVVDTQTGKLTKSLANVVNGADKLGLTFHMMMEGALNGMQFLAHDQKRLIGVFPRYEPSGYQPAIVDPEKGGLKLLGGPIPEGESFKGAALSSNDRWLAVITEPESSDRQYVNVYDAQGGKQVAKIDFPYPEEALTLLVALSGDRLLVMVDDPDSKTSSIRAFQGPSFKPANQWSAPAEHNLRPPFTVSPDGKKLVVGYHDPDTEATFKILNPTDFSTIRELSQSDGLYAAKDGETKAWSPNGRYLAVHDDESGRVVILDTDTGDFVFDQKTNARATDLSWGTILLRWIGTQKLIVVGADGPLQQHPPVITTITSPVGN